MRWTKGWPAICFALPLVLAAQATQTPQTMPQIPSSAAPAIPAPPPFVVLLDAAHGGSDIGARLTPTLLEKDLTLDLTNRLRSMLAARGFDLSTTRNSDTTLSTVGRAEIANSKPAAACLIVHATATGSGVHLYTSSLSPSPLEKFMPWQTAQSAYITQSLKLSSDIDSALAHAEIPVTLGRTSLQPMDSFACPAVAVEIAPLQPGASTKGSLIVDEAYQRNILGALAAALDEWRNEWKQQP
ncbi:MAG TPA: N-acetylmuramoyl-L-alanine amidase [Silvibacterium sp.]|nr:N-acetylmuramoyl-L-alanine amidase [Silvibacterium sp.]